LKEKRIVQREASTQHLCIALMVCTAAALAGCSEEGSSQRVESNRPTVYVVNYPLKYFAERIGGDRVDVRFPVPADEDPAFWQPSSDDIAAYQSADLILLNGATYAKWIEKVSLPSSKTVDTSAAFHGTLIKTASTVTHSHGPGGEHAHAGTAFTTWIDFEQANGQAKAVKETLLSLLPNHAPEFESNFATLQNELSELDSAMHEIAKRIGDGPLVASHPVYQYLARRYDLRIKAVHWEPDVVPDDKATADLKQLLADHPANWMIWEGEPDVRSVQLLETVGLGSVVFDPCSNTPSEGDWLTEMKRNVDRMKAVAASSR
jgi:zinc transport system substrate-binding protein